MNNVADKILSFEEHSTKIRKNNSTFSSSENDYVISDNKPNQIKASRETISDFQITDPQSNKNLMNAVYDGKVKEGENMSDDIAKTVGKLEANYEHMREHQKKLEEKIDDMPKKITQAVKEGLETEIQKIKTEIEKSSKENNRWVFGVAITVILSMVVFYYNVSNKIDQVNTKPSTSTQPNIIMIPYPEAQQKQSPIVNIPVPQTNPTKKEKDTS